MVRTKVFELDEDSWYLNQEKNDKFIITPGFFINLEEIPRDKIQASSNNIFYVRIPQHYMFLLGDRAGIVPTHEPDILCAERDEDGNIIPSVDDTIEASIETIDSQLRNSLSEHRIKWCKARPLRLM